MTKRIFLFYLFLLFSSFVFGQTEGANPFDLTPRIKAAKAAERAAGNLVGVPANPFDIVRRQAIPLPDVPAIEPTLEERTYIDVAKAQEKFRQFFFVAFMGMLVLLTICFTLFRNSFVKAWRAFLNDNMLTQIHREQSTIANLPYILMNIFFFINLALFIQLAAQIFGFQITNKGNWTTFFLLTFGVTGIFVLKHLLIKLIGAIFPVSKAMHLYAFTITIFCAILGLFLIPFNAFVAYAPENLMISLFWVTVSVIILTYLFRTLRGLFIGGRYIASYQFHFLLYICTVEVAPVLILIRIILNQG